jgi:predicted ATPase
MPADGAPEPSAELERARNVQLSMLPEIPVIESLEIAAHYRPCDTLGGDFYDFITIDAWRLGIVVADVSGHGAAAALLMAVAKKVLQLCSKGNPSPRQALLEVNDSIRADMPSGMFLSALYGVLDIRNHRLSLASCGHNPPLWRRGAKVTEIQGKHNAPVLGVMPSEQLRGYLHEEHVQLAPDDLLVFYTDGITEAFNSERAMYGAPRLQSRVREGALSAQMLVDTIRHDVDKFRSSAVISDDEPMVVVRVGKRAKQARPLDGPSSAPAAEMPHFLLPLLGRDAEVSAVREMIESIEKPVLTITGPAGAGKTRVAVAAAEATRDRFPGGFHYVDLRGAVSPMDVCRAVADVMRLGDDETRLGLRIAMALQSPAGRSLLLLDNCEGCAVAVKRCIEEWRTRTTTLQVVATSRIAFEAKNEACHNVAPMDAPKSASLVNAEQAAQRFAIIRLFTQRAQQADASFRLTDENVRDVAMICAKLDGLPQAVELAAARIDVLTPRQIVEGLDRRLDLLAEGDGEERNTLSGTLAFSWELLTDAEKRALMLLSQFPTGFQPEVAAEVLKGVGERAPEDLLGGLLKHSLLHHDTPDELEGERRFHVYESFRLFALDKLAAGNGDARERYETALLNYTLELWKRDQQVGSQAARERMQFELDALLEIASQTSVPENRAWATVLAAPILHAKGEKNRATDMLRAAQEGIFPGSDEDIWIRLTDGALRAVEAPETVAAMLERIDGNDDADIRFNALHTRASALHAMGRTEEAVEVVRQASKIPGLSRSRQAMLKSRLGVLFADSGRTQEARNLFESALMLAREADDKLLTGRTLFNLGWLNLRSDQSALSVPQLTETLEIAEYEGDRTLEASALGGLALALHFKGEKQEAEAYALRGIRICRELGRSLTECAQLSALARIYHEQGRTKDALQMAVRGRDLAREIGARRSEALAESNLASLRMDLGEEDGALEAWQTSYQILTELNDKRGALSCLGNIGGLQAQQWRKGGSRRQLGIAIDTLSTAVNERRQLGYDPLLEQEITLAELLIEAARRGDARELLDKTLAAAEQRGDELGRRIAEKAGQLQQSIEALPGKRTRRVMPGSQRMQAAATRTPPPRVVAPPPVLTPPPVVQTPPARGSSDKLPKVAPPPRKGSSGKIALPPQKTTSSSPPPIKAKRPKGIPGQPPRKRPRGYP